MAIMVDTTLYDNRRMRLIGAVCPRKVVSEFVATSIVVLNIAKLRRVLIYFNSAKHSNSLQRVLDRRLNELRATLPQPPRRRSHAISDHRP